MARRRSAWPPSRVTCRSCKRLVEAGADVNLYGWPPLIYAAFNGHTAVVEYLITRGADIDATTENGSTALFFAARFGHLQIVELLLQNKADASIANDRGATADDWARQTGNTNIADILRQASDQTREAREQERKARDQAREAREQAASGRARDRARYRPIPRSIGRPSRQSENGGRGRRPILPACRKRPMTR
jgi:hypothetical protein